MLPDDPLKRHPLFAELVPILAAGPPGAVVRLRFNGGRPVHYIPDFPLPVSPAGALYALPWPVPVSAAQRAVCAAVGAWLDTIWTRRAQGDLIITLDSAGQPTLPVRWQGPVPVSAAARERGR
jgi:hypothetical protein